MSDADWAGPGFSRPGPIEDDMLLENIDPETVTPEEIQFAELLHSIQCKYNHTDGCGWYYENWTDKLWWSRSNYIRLARDFMYRLGDSVKPADAVQVLTLLKQLRYV